jgi:hypothetical protein
MVTFRPTKTRPVGMHPHELTFSFAATGLSEPSNLVSALCNIGWTYDAERWPVLTAATIRYWHPQRRSSIYVELEDATHHYDTGESGDIVTAGIEGVVLKALVAVPHVLTGTDRYQTWWRWADKGLGAMPGTPVSVCVEGAEMSAMYDQLTRSSWLLVILAPLAGTWVALHGNMRIAPDDLALQEISLRGLPAEFPLPDLRRAPKPRRR